MDTRTDEEIVSIVKRGEKEFFGVIIERYEAKIMRYARRFFFNNEEAKDLTQEIFLKAYINVQSFNTSRRFSPWLYRIAHNEFINAIRRKSRLPISFFDPDEIFPHPVAEGGPEDDFHMKEMKKILERNMEKLDLKYREPLTLYYYEEMDYKSIAEVLRVPISTVGVRISRGKEKIKKLMEDEKYE